MNDINTIKNIVNQWLIDHQPTMFTTLKTIVNIDSPSNTSEGVKSVGDALIHLLTQSNVNAKWVCEKEALGVLAHVGNKEGKTIFLTGHMDTVFENGTTNKRPYYENNGVAYGPGVADMKSGLVMNCFILMALRAYEIMTESPLPFCVKMLATCDEEIGSPTGRQLIFTFVKGAIAVFNAEPGRISGNVVSSRKGGDSYKITVLGKAAHAGVSHEDGVSAIEALARITQSIHALTNYDTGISTNIGLIQGGTTPNTVAEYAMAKLDVRYITEKQRKLLLDQIKNCLNEHQLEGAQANLEHIAGFLPLESKWSKDLLRIYKKQAMTLGLHIDGEFTGGCSDAGWTASLGIPTLCSTGPIGAYMHTDREYCLLNTMVQRAEIVTQCCLLLGFNIHE